MTIDESEEVWDCIKRRARADEGDYFEQIGGQLTNGEWAVDAHLLLSFRGANEVGFEMRSEFPKYTRLMERLVTREAVRKALDVEGIAASL